MEIIFVIPGELPDMNNIIKMSKSHYMVYSKMKKKYTEIVRLSASNLPTVESADFEITWYCKNRRKDKDNIASGQKFIFDGLVNAGVIKNDGWSEIGDVSHKFGIDKKNPRIEVRLYANQI